MSSYSAHSMPSLSLKGNMVWLYLMGVTKSPPPGNLVFQTAPTLEKFLVYSSTVSCLRRSVTVRP